MRNVKNIYRLDLRLSANESWDQGASDGIHFVLCSVLLRARRAIKCHFSAQSGHSERALGED